MVLETTTDKTSEILSACRVQLGGEDRMIPSKGFPRFPMCLLTKIQSMFPGSVGPSPRLGTAVLTPNTDVDTFKCLRASSPSLVSDTGHRTNQYRRP